MRQGLVEGFLLGIFGDDVPGVQQARDEAEHAEADVDEGVGGTDAAFDPDCEDVLARFQSGDGDGDGGTTYQREVGTGWRLSRGRCPRSTF